MDVLKSENPDKSEKPEKKEKKRKRKKEDGFDQKAGGGLGGPDKIKKKKLKDKEKLKLKKGAGDMKGKLGKDTIRAAVLPCE